MNDTARHCDKVVVFVRYPTYWHQLGILLPIPTGGCEDSPWSEETDTASDSHKNYQDYSLIQHMTQFYTIGHSSRSIEEFLSALQAHGIDLVVDVRRFPGSKHNPQFNADTLAETLAEHEIEYRHLKVLGG